MASKITTSGKSNSPASGAARGSKGKVETAKVQATAGPVATVPPVKASAKDASAAIVAGTNAANPAIKKETTAKEKATKQPAASPAKDVTTVKLTSPAAKPTAGGPHGIALVPAATAELDTAEPVRDAAFYQQIEAAIRWRAYELYLERGGRNGSADYDWAVAEQEIQARFMQRSA